MAFVTPVVEHWLERELAQWVHHEGSIQLAGENSSLRKLQIGWILLINLSHWFLVVKSEAVDQQSSCLTLFSILVNLNKPTSLISGGNSDEASSSSKIWSRRPTIRKSSCLTFFSILVRCLRTAEGLTTRVDVMGCGPVSISSRMFSPHGWSNCPAFGSLCNINNRNK